MNTIILFPSTNLALWGEDELKNTGIECKMISIPREVSSDCGYCVQINPANKIQAQSILQEKQIEFSKILDI